MTETKKTGERLPNVFEAFLPVLVLLGLMLANFLFEWGNDPHIYVLLAAITCCVVGKLCNVPLSEMMAAGFASISQILEALFILLFVGCLVGSFEWAGVIPAIVYYGLQIFTPAVFLPAVVVLCAIVGLSLGSSYTVSATLGIAFMSIGATMGINPAMIAGAVLSGACTGDKFSPLSDSTNLAAAASQTGLFDHVKAMIGTTFPAFLIAFVIYCVMSLTGKAGTYDPELVDGLSNAIKDNFAYMSPVLLLPVAVIILVAILQMPGIPGVLLASLTGCIFAVIFQGASFAECIAMVHYGYSAETGNELADTLLNRGGMDSMLWTINMALIAIGFGGMYSRCGAVERLLGGMIKKIKTPFHLMAAVIVTAMFCILTMCDQYLGLIIPPAMYKEKIDDMGLSRNVLSRCTEDGGTLFSALVPWSSCGVYHSSMLGVSTMAYLPYCFTNILNPIISLATAAWGGNIIFADGSRTGFFGGKVKAGKPAGAPAEEHEHALKRLAELRADGTYKEIGK
ncbi:Na+/H+ antiporter NhaC family protein [Emergencia sp. JLR.KK010]|jgi:NhaC family Na+:H+ antiporter|uniref:Na+/H+ antiporter NhaC family protein n=1 Tax=Emergencia sp. JLR.KK010 TaxID=3114296 RepID=UPI0030D3135F